MIFLCHVFGLGELGECNAEHVHILLVPGPSPGKVQQSHHQPSDLLPVWAL
jgi:hypothetical protein